MINIKSKGLVLSKLKGTKQPSSKLLKQDQYKFKNTKKNDNRIKLAYVLMKTKTTQNYSQEKASIFTGETHRPKQMH